jgi:hypothetical protein
MDGAYTQKYVAVAKMLLDASGGDPARIPGHYAEHLRHEYNDGDISLAYLLPKLESVDALEDYEIEEAIEILGKVNPEDWPYPNEIESVDVEELLRVYDEDASSLEYMEAPGTTSEKAELVLRHAIESVWGDIVDKVRSDSGKYPDEDNQYLQQPDGSYKGSFEYDGKKFDFVIEPDDVGWILQYRMATKSLDALPPITDMDNQEEESSRNKGWR